MTEQAKRKSWINRLHSDGCEIQLFDREYTIWLSGRNMEQIERDAQHIVDCLNGSALDELRRELAVMTDRFQNADDFAKNYAYQCGEMKAELEYLKRDNERLEQELKEYKMGSRIEAREGDAAREDNQRLREALSDCRDFVLYVQDHVTCEIRKEESNKMEQCKLQLNTIDSSLKQSACE